jgi:3-mercaptopyruvate sulfurtransferase SseA
MNHEKVSVLDGGLPRYQMEGLALDETPLSSEAEALARIEQVCIPIKRFISKLILWNAVG